MSKIPQTKEKNILNIFNKIIAIPRTSGNETEIAKWLINWANDNNFVNKQDEVGNVVITVPATQGYEDKPGFVLQGHMDMVGQKVETSRHDFSKDPIIAVVDGKWLKTNGETTLGADNGIAMAMTLSLAIDNAPHPELELLFTVDEETGLTGALKLGEDMLTQKSLINLDSEIMGYITIGCAGSSDSTISKVYPVEKLKDKMQLVKMTLKGGQGGHSGIEIHKKIANTHILMARFLKRISEGQDINIVSINGGTVRNAIPRNTRSVIACSDLKQVNQIKEDFEKNIIKGEYGNVEKELTLQVQEFSDNEDLKQFKNENTREIIATLLTIPHGVIDMSNEVEGLAETSNNLAIIKIDANDKDLEKDNLGIAQYFTMHRSSVDSRIIEVTDKLESIAVLLGADFEVGSSSPAWQPNPESDLLRKVAKTYKDTFSKEPVIEAIHAGLECGVIGEKFEGMEMVSFGPTIKGAHTPEERLLIEDIDKIMLWLEAILAG